ncbi:MAG: phosphate ABC transporter permease PstA [Lachnospiraceae bacterium]|nr:phosphate ABC transporter permease PstA [Lachnospiraceae bacterium]
MNHSICRKKVRISDFIMYGLIYLCAAISVLLIAGIIVYVFWNGFDKINWEFLTTTTSFLEDTVGIAGNILNTIYIIVLTMLIATPIGVGAAIYLNEYAKPGKLVKLIELATETLSGIPSIIFGLFGMMFFGTTLGLNYSILTGTLTLTLMVLPLITRNTQEALKTVPNGYRQGAIGLGAGKWYMIRTILLPSSMPGIITGVILAIGRIGGESAALLYTAGSSDLLPATVKGYLDKIFQSGGTLTIQLYLSASKGEFDVAFGVAVVLLIIVLGINFATKLLAKKFDVNRMS